MHRDELRKFEDELPEVGQMVAICVNRPKDLFTQPEGLIFAIPMLWNKKLDEAAKGPGGMRSYWQVSSAYWIDISDALRNACKSQSGLIAHRCREAEVHLKTMEDRHVYS